ncbi:hypothetical protein CW693_04745, partial [Candidatus Bathyarchaeota archaeon]
MNRPSFPTHKQCANYKNGFCTIYGIPVNPDDPACPNFTPKTMTQTAGTPQTTYTPTQPPLPPQTANFPQYTPGWGRGGGYGYGMSAGGGGQGRGRRGSGGAGGGRGFG